MTRSTEARFWQVLGLLLGMAGVVILSYEVFEFGLASILPTAMRLGMTGGVMVVGGTACFVAGRALQVEETVLTPGESTLWLVLGWVASLSGAVVVGLSFTQRSLLGMDRLAMLLAGALALVAGLVCLLGQRVMTHMRGMYVSKVAEEKIRAAGA